jgi:hypothetical protein
LNKCHLSKIFFDGSVASGSYFLNSIYVSIFTWSILTKDPL